MSDSLTPISGHLFPVADDYQAAMGQLQARLLVAWTQA